MTAWIVALALGSAPADDPPVVEHQQVPCTVPDQPLTLCTAVRDDGDVAKVRVFFRREGESHYLMVEMAFDGLRYCGTLPGPRRGKVKSLEYYVEAVDAGYQSSRTSTYRMPVQAEAACGFAPVEKDPARLSAIVVRATHPKQGRKLPHAFLGTGVSFVPAGGR
jgi:hypothetical protein